MPKGSDVVLLHRLALFPRLTPGDGKELVDFSGVVQVVAGHHDDDVVERSRWSPVEWVRSIEVLLV